MKKSRKVGNTIYLENNCEGLQNWESLPDRPRDENKFFIPDRLGGERLMVEFQKESTVVYLADRVSIKSIHELFDEIKKARGSKK